LYFEKYSLHIDSGDERTISIENGIRNQLYWVCRQPSMSLLLFFTLIVCM